MKFARATYTTPSVTTFGISLRPRLSADKWDTWETVSDCMLMNLALALPNCLSPHNRDNLVLIVKIIMGCNKKYEMTKYSLLQGCP